MVEQLTLDQAIEAGRQGAEAAAEHSGEAWRIYALAFLETYLERHETMHTDELWDAGLGEPVSPRALGAVMQQAVRARWMDNIRSAGAYEGVLARPSVRSHGQLKPVWRSLLYKGLS